MNIDRVLDSRRGRVEVNYNEPEECPICKHAIKPQEICIHAYYTNSNQLRIGALYLCPHCQKPFVVFYSVLTTSHPFIGTQEYIAPDVFVKEDFDDLISELSPQFVKICNQANAAECFSLDEIAGIGYRKALEFLIKDYCKRTNPDEAEAIERTPLGACINQYISSSQIQTLASRAVWIGNDETHYTRKLEDRDVSDMKKFINAALHYISMELIVADASSIDPVR